MIFTEKIQYLKNLLYQTEENYADSFKQDIVMYFEEDFTIENIQMQFLNQLNSEEEIKNWIEFITSQFVLKFDSEQESEKDFIDYYLSPMLANSSL